LAEHEAAVAARDLAVTERDAAFAARDLAVTERDAAFAARDLALAERDDMAEIGNIITAQGDKLQTIADYKSFQQPLPLPPEDYMRLVCGDFQTAPLSELFESAGKIVVDLLDGQKMIEKNTKFLDIGCGCGRLSRSLLNKEIASYTGFDRHQGMINWCRKEITSRFPNYRFYYFNITNGYEAIDHEKGNLSASRFPFKDNAFDSILLASVFTHMPLPEISHYLQEIYRTLDKNGKVMLSIFFNDEEEGEKTIDHYNFFFGERLFLDTIEAVNFEYEFYTQTGLHRWYILKRPALG
jgi:SAM-dependent methyltransferase